jgi:large subunit ribosomal protein L31
MRKDIHPNQQLIIIKCVSCETEFNLNSTQKKVAIDVCSGCHPFYLGTTISLKAAGRVDRFKNRLAKKNAK